MNNLYFVDFGGIHWGTHMRDSGFFGQVFRRKRMKFNHWYVSGKFTFRIYTVSSAYSVFGCMAEVILPNGSHCHFAVNHGRCIGISEKGEIFYPLPQRTATQRRDLRNTFRNRLIEYGTSYFVPMEKGLKNVV